MTDVSVEPTPIQRNEFDIAYDLLKVHLDIATVEASEIPKLYAEYYSLVKLLQYSNQLEDLLPEGLKDKI